MPDLDEREHLSGDLYVQFDGYHILLIDNDGKRDKNIICFDRDDIEAFLKYLVQFNNLPKRN